MKKVPCIICRKLVDTDIAEVMATVCEECNKGNIDKVLKNLDYKTLKSMMPIVTSDGKMVNEYGEVI